jgi:hypothetical protein
MMTQSRGNKGPVALILLPAVTVDVTFATATGAERLTLDATRAGGARMRRPVQSSGDSALDSDVTQVAVLIIRPQQHHPVEIVPLVIPVEKRAYLQPRDAPQSRILDPRRGIPD